MIFVVLLPWLAALLGLCLGVAVVGTASLWLLAITGVFFLVGLLAAWYLSVRI